MRRPCSAFLLAAALLGCSEPSGDPDPGDASAADARVVADGAPGPDAPRACLQWTRVEVASTAPPVSIDPVAVTTARTTRVEITAALTTCDELAMTVVRYDEATRRAFAPVAALRPDTPCEPRPEPVTRPVALRFPTVGTWTVHAGPDASAPSIEVVVGAPPDRACGVAGACAMDCDCTETEPGTRCLGGVGLGGPFTQCARPCELDRDCGGAGVCRDVEDGLTSACVDGIECDDARPCADGFACEAGACVATFSLGTGNRVACGCDADCAGPLRCIADADGDGARCEVTCPTDGPWCDGAHFCGTRFQDVSGLAAVDGVCGWVGE